MAVIRDGGPPRAQDEVRISPRAISQATASANAIDVGVIGYGYWGPTLASNINQAEGCRVVAVCDTRRERLREVQARYPAMRVFTDFRTLISEPRVDAVAIATPVSTHYSLTLAALQAGKHVLVAEPLATSSEQALELLETSARLKRVLMVDHTFVYSGAVQKIKELVDSGQLGRIYYYDSVRVNLGLFQHDVSVTWDLGVQDLSMMDYVLGREPIAVAAVGAAHVPGQPVNTAYLTCFFEHDIIAHFHLNWRAPVKIRRTLIGGDRQMVVYDDLEPSEKVRVYDRGVTVTTEPRQDMEGDYELLVAYRTGDMHAPRIAVTEALRVEAQHFIDCIRSGRRPLTDGLVGLRVIRVLEAAERSVADRGRRVNLE